MQMQLNVLKGEYLAQELKKIYQHTQSKIRLYVLHTDCTFLLYFSIFNEYRDDKKSLS